MARKLGWAEMDKSNIPLEKLRSSYKLYNRAANKSPRTISWYDEKLGLLQRFVGDDATLRDFTVDNVRAFIAELQVRNVRNGNHPKMVRPGKLSSAYIQGFARAFRAFASWLYEDGYTETNLLKTMKPPKIQQKVIPILSETEIEDLLLTFNRSDPFGARNYAITITLLDTGLRASELLDLTVDNSHLRRGFLKVLGKGNKERLVPIGLRCSEALQLWMERFRPQFDDAGLKPYLFLNANGERMTVRALEEMIARAGTHASIAGLHPHRLRHTFATRFLTLGLGDTFQLQHFLGHTSLEMVRRYVSAASVEKALMERRPSAMDRMQAGRQNLRPAKRISARGSAALRLLK